MLICVMNFQFVVIIDVFNIYNNIELWQQLLLFTAICPKTNELFGMDS